MRLSDLAARLSGVTWSGDSSFTARCPAHADSNPSLSAANGAKGIVLKCHAGCAADAIVAALGLEWADLFPPKPEAAKKRSPAKQPVTLAELAAAKKIPVEWLREHGVDQFPDGRGVAIGYFYEDEKQAERLRVRSALKAKDGCSWDGPKGTQPIPYGLWLLKEAREKKSLIIVEGETDCWALWFHGYPALGLPGATNVKGLLPEHLREIDRVYVIQEPDAAGSAFPLRVAQQARKNGYKGEIRLIAMGAGGKDPADLHVAGTFDVTFSALLEAAKPFEAATADSEIIPATASQSITQAYVKNVGPTIRRWDGSWWHWLGMHSARCSEEDQRSLVARFIITNVILEAGKQVKELNKSIMENVMDALRAHLNLPSTVRPPCWLDGAAPFDPKAIATVENGLVELSTGKIYPPSPHWFCLSALQTEYDPDATCPEWEAFLEELWEDQQSRDTLQEMFGYLLTSDMSQQKAFLIIGPPRSGKGTIGRILASLLGPDAVSRPALADFGTPFGLEPLIGKSLAIISDARLDQNVPAGVLAERLLAISGEDTINIARKYKDSWNGPLSVRFLLLTNELPLFSDASGALPNRFVLLRMTRTWLGKEDPMLFARLVREMPGILNWAMVGWMRLQERGHFVQPSASREIASQLTNIASRVATFIEDGCVLDNERDISITDLHRHYVKWCRDTETKPLPVTLFGRDLRASFSNLNFYQPHGQPRRVQGIGIKFWDGSSVSEEKKDE